HVISRSGTKTNGKISGPWTKSRWAGTPQEIAEGAVWLCSDAASFVIGHARSPWTVLWWRSEEHASLAVVGMNVAGNRQCHGLGGMPVA
ncbi:MAG TPA: hypothetical protein VJT73_10745, partial [Polyangiaceae bacterium]|nr:hypothetical protein [Polyangiaceae bacterium]